MDIARLISRRQPEITREEAYEERECGYFQRCDEEADKEFIFELTPEEIEAAREIAIQFQKELEKELTKSKLMVKRNRGCAPPAGDGKR